MKNRAAIYVRQSIREDMGIAHQIVTCADRAKSEGWEVVGEPYEDNFVSASKSRGEGTAWGRLLADIDAGLIDVVIAVSVDRLLRRVTDVLEVTTPKRDVRVVTARDGIDTDAALGKTMLMIVTALAEAEIETKRERMIPYATSRHEKGHPSPGRVPYGYRWIPKLQRDTNETRYEKVAHEAEIVRFMFSETLAGASLASICRELNARGAATRDGRKWGTTTVRRLLLSPFMAALLPERTFTAHDNSGKRLDPYKAERVDISKCRPGAWDPIVSVDEVLATRHLLMDPTRRKHDGNTARKWLLTGIATCSCGAGIQSARSKEKHRAYRGQCGHFQRRAEIIDEFVVDAVLGVLCAPGVLVYVPEDGVDPKALRATRTALASKRRRARDLWRENTFTDVEYREEVSILDANMTEVDNRLAEAAKTDPLAEVMTARDVREVWSGLTLARRQTIIRELLAAVIVHPVGKGRRIVSLGAAAETITLIWHDSVRRYTFDRNAAPIVEPKITSNAKKVIAQALNP